MNIYHGKYRMVVLEKKEIREEDFSSPWTPDWSVLTASHFIVFFRILSRQDILEQEKEEKRTFPALGPQTGQC